MSAVNRSLDPPREAAPILPDHPREAPLTSSPLPLSRILLAAGIAALPSLFAFILLVIGGALAADVAVLATLGVFAALVLLVSPVARGINELRQALEAMTDHEDAVPLVRSASPIVTELWIAVSRLTRNWRHRLGEREAELEATLAVLAALPDPVLLLDQRRQIVRANAAAAEMFGSNLVGRDLAAVLRNPAILGAADAVLRGEGERNVELTMHLPVERQFSARMAPFAASGAGNLADGGAAILTLHDLTAAKRSEQMRADFVANASHELRTPLATLLGFIETLRGPAREDRDAEDRFLAIMHEQASRMARLIEDLLSLSRIEMNEHVTPTGRANLHHVIGSVAATLELRAKARGMRVAIELAPDLPEVQGDPDELAQVFQNLLENAIKYGREGTVIEVASRLPPRRDAAAPLVAITVRDHGEGIAREHLPRLTERFYRVDTARSRAMGGTGLGLAIVKHIINRHRGRLEIASDLGTGSVFTVALPAATADAVAGREVGEGQVSSN
jgi:two-component system, OmpR family, phosphate regulon sensor histidine kinase PhoR